jgi:hypothetical protein
MSLAGSGTIRVGLLPSLHLPQRWIYAEPELVKLPAEPEPELVRLPAEAEPAGLHPELELVRLPAEAEPTGLYPELKPLRLPAETEPLRLLAARVKFSAQLEPVSLPVSLAAAPKDRGLKSCY